MDIISHFKIRDRVKTWTELLAWLPTRVDFIPRSTTDENFITPYHWELLKETVFHSPVNQTYGLLPEDFVFSCYQLLDTPRNEEYIKPLIPFRRQAYVIFEHRTGYFECSSNKLFLELVIERGITPEDVRTQSLDFKQYSFFMKQYLAHEY